tara:strand:+ start:97 stop:627 length:531 start_codon:yes stop_codon:yes gene_type:complete
MKYTHKIAVSSDISSISKLMDLAIEGNMAKLLSEEQLEAAKESMGLDTQLIKDQTYFVVYAGQILVGCGGFSYRKTLFGGDHTPNRSDGLLDPILDPAKIRAMYTHPLWARKGVGTYILKLAEKESEKRGFKSFELMATVSGKLLYEKRDYQITEQIDYLSKVGNKVPMYRMMKKI